MADLEVALSAIKGVARHWLSAEALINSAGRAATAHQLASGHERLDDALSSYQSVWAQHAARAAQAAHTAAGQTYLAAMAYAETDSTVMPAPAGLAAAVLEDAAAGGGDRADRLLSSAPPPPPKPR